jgi:TIR domain
VKRPGLRTTLLRLIYRSLCNGDPVEIDGLGRFELNANQVVFRPSDRPRVFLAYANEDRASVKKLCTELHRAGFDPWMDEEKLLPGQNWPRAIEQAIELADYVVLCFSAQSVDKRGYFQLELRYALDVASCVPLDEIFLMPVRLSECTVPLQIARRTQYIDLFPDWDMGVKALMLMMNAQAALRKTKRNFEN